MKYTDKQLEKIYCEVAFNQAPREPDPQPIRRCKFKKIYKAPGYPVVRRNFFYPADTAEFKAN